LSSGYSLKSWVIASMAMSPTSVGMVVRIVRILPGAKPAVFGVEGA
jgi:hypothetical protein